jgi:hypothetical protein
MGAFRRKAHANRVARSKFRRHRVSIRNDAETVLQRYLFDKEGKDVQVQLDEDGNVLSGEARTESDNDEDLWADIVDVGELQNL